MVVGDLTLGVSRLLLSETTPALLEGLTPTLFTTELRRRITPLALVVEVPLGRDATKPVTGVLGESDEGFALGVQEVHPFRGEPLSSKRRSMKNRPSPSFLSAQRSLSLL